jgi:2-polyprenyl-3-methyl-5-hydroxy-6-metoxy-1,4-benzoquinol methylase
MRYRRKRDWIIPFITGKKVLDLGCVSHDLSAHADPEWLHGIIKKHASSVQGVDYLADAVEGLRSRGYNVTCANVETMSLGDKFDVIVAGDLVEHLSNPGMFFGKLNEHLEAGGKVLLTTPNPFNLLRFMQHLIYGKQFINKEHASWMTSETVAQLAARYGLKITGRAYVNDSYLYWKITFFWMPFIALNSLLTFFLPRFSETQCFVLEKV